MLKRALPVTFYRCHDCGYRRARLVHGWKGFATYLLSLIGYGAAAAVVMVIVAGAVTLVLAMIGISLPWTH